MYILILHVYFNQTKIKKKKLYLQLIKRFKHTSPTNKHISLEHLEVYSRQDDN
jgi:hypothetical protein